MVLAGVLVSYFTRGTRKLPNRIPLSSIVHTMRNVFEGLIYGLSVLLPVAVALGGLAPLGTYMKIVIWLQLWVPFYVILNLFGDMEMARAMAQLSTLTDGGGISVKMWGEVGEKAQLSLGYLGSLAFTVPMFAWGLLKGGEYAMSSAVGAMTSGGGAAQTAATTGGQIAGQGNVSMGNRSFMNDNVMSSTMQSSGRQFMVNAGNVDMGNRLEKLTGLNVAEQTSVAGVTSGLSQIKPALQYGPEAIAEAAVANTGKAVEKLKARQTSGGFTSLHDAAVATGETDGKAEAIQTGHALRDQQYWLDPKHGGKYTNSDGTINTDKVGALSGLWAATDTMSKGVLSENKQDQMKTLEKLDEYYKVDQKFLTALEATQKDKSLTPEQKYEKVARGIQELETREAWANKKAMDVLAKVTGQSVPDAMQHKAQVVRIAGQDGKFMTLSFNQRGDQGYEYTLGGVGGEYFHNTMKNNYGTGNFSVAENQIIAGFQKNNAKDVGQGFSGDANIWSGPNKEKMQAQVSRLGTAAVKEYGDISKIASITVDAGGRATVKGEVGVTVLGTGFQAIAEAYVATGTKGATVNTGNFIRAYSDGLTKSLDNSSLSSSDKTKAYVAGMTQLKEQLQTVATRKAAENAAAPVLDTPLNKTLSEGTVNLVNDPVGAIKKTSQEINNLVESGIKAIRGK